MTSLSSTGVRRLVATLRQTRDPIFLVDPQGRLSYVNAAWESLVGLSASTIAEVARGEPCAGETAPRVEEVTLALSPPAETLRGEAAGGAVLMPVACGDLEKRWVDFWPYMDEKSQLLGVIGMIRPGMYQSGLPSSPSHDVMIELLELRRNLRLTHGNDALLGRGPRHERLMNQVKAASACSSPVLIVGEKGTGRSHVGRAIHRLGAASAGPFLPLDLPAITPDVMERILLQDPSGGIDAEVSCWLLREALGLPRDLQASLAAVLLEKRLRVIGTTVEEPEQAFARGGLREDFYFEMTTYVIRLVPLRERVEELPVLAMHFLDLANRRNDRRRSGFDPATLQILQEYDWPGNLGELSRVIHAAHGEGADPLIQIEDLPASIRGAMAGSYLPPNLPQAVMPLDPWLTQMERQMIEQALSQARHNKSRAADLLGISRPRLYRRIKELNIPEEVEPSEA